MITDIEQLNQDLIEAARDGDLQQVKNLLNNEDDPNHRNEKQHTALLWAARNNHKDIVKKLLEQKYINTALMLGDKDGITALMCAVFSTENQSQSTTILNILLEKLKDHFRNSSEENELKSHIDQRNIFGETALILAAHAGDKECVEILLGEGADVNIRDKEGDTALMWALYNKDIESVKMLLEKPGIELTEKGKYGWTPLMNAVAGRNLNQSIDILEAILDKLKIHHESDHDALIKHINETNEKGNTALMIAARHGAENCVKVLLSKGADVNIKNTVGNTALMIATGKGNYAIAKLLIEHGSSLAERNKNGQTAIDCAVKNNELDTALRILELAIQKAVEKNPSDRSEGERGETKENDTVNTNGAPSPFDCLSEASRNTLLRDFFFHNHPALNFIPEEFKDACFVYLLKNPNQIVFIEEFHQVLNETDNTTSSSSVSTETKDGDSNKEGAYNPDLNTILTEFFSHQSEFFSISKKSNETLQIKKDDCFINLLKNLEHITLIIKVHGLSDQVLKDILIDMQMYLLLSETDTTDPIKKAKYKFIKSLLVQVVNHFSLLEGPMSIEKITANMFRDSMQKEEVYKGSYFFSIFRCRCREEKLVDRLKEFFSNTDNKELNAQHGINQKSLN